MFLLLTVPISTHLAQVIDQTTVDLQEDPNKFNQVQEWMNQGFIFFWERMFFSHTFANMHHCAKYKNCEHCYRHYCKTNPILLAKKKIVTTGTSLIDIVQ